MLLFGLITGLILNNCRKKYKMNIKNVTMKIINVRR